MPARILALALALCTVFASAASLDALDTRIDAERMRASSHDLAGLNRDHAVINAGQTITLAELDGPGVIQHIWFTVSSGDYRYPAKTILRIYWDDATEPSVQTPLGDFFCAGNGMRVNVNSTPVQVSAEGRAYNCYWRMPFKKHARITVENQSNVRMSALYYYIDWTRQSRPERNMRYFHAQYRQAHPHVPPDNYVILDTTGEGHYVGTVLSSENSYHAWFGEGDDLVYIDGEAEPRLTGTGTEDYFNDAWGFREFSYPDSGVPIFEGRSIDARVTAYRWHIADPITYRKSLLFTIENKGWVSRESGESVGGFVDRRDNYSSVAFFYQKAQATGVPPMPPLSERIDPEIWLSSARLTEVAQVTAGRGRNAFNRNIPGRRFFHVPSTQPDTVVTIPVEIKQKGRYSVSIWKLSTPDGGIYEVSLDGKRIEPRLDFYGEAKLTYEDNDASLLRSMKERKLGLYYLDPGTHELTFTCIGRNPASYLAGTMRAGYGLGMNAVSFRNIPFENMDQYLK